jgi:hypothetical protein
VFDWREFFRLAERLVEDDGQPAPAGPNLEARARSAISRAYYAAYNLAQLRANEVGLDTSPDVEECETDHEACWRAFKGDQSNLNKRIGADGNNLRRLRNQADYQETLRDVLTKAVGAVDDARRIINNLSQ